MIRDTGRCSLSGLLLLLLVLLVLTGGLLQDRYNKARHGEYIPFDIEHNTLSFQTFSRLGSNDVAKIRFYTSKTDDFSEVSEIEIKFTSAPIEISMTRCHKSQDAIRFIGSNRLKTWNITKLHDRLIFP